MGSAIGFLVGKQIFGKTITEGVARWIVTAALFLVILCACAGLIAAYNHHVIAANNQKVERRAAPATDKAAAERADDAIANAKAEQEMHDVIHSVPDAAPAGPSHALACKRLRDLGRNPPACR
jgi:hypothetical protein